MMLIVSTQLGGYAAEIPIPKRMLENWENPLCSIGPMEASSAAATLSADGDGPGPGQQRVPTCLVHGADAWARVSEGKGLHGDTLVTPGDTGKLDAHDVAILHNAARGLTVGIGGTRPASHPRGHCGVVAATGPHGVLDLGGQLYLRDPGPHCGHGCVHADVGI